MSWAVEMLICEGHLLFLKKTQVLIPAPTLAGSQPPVTPTPRGPVLSSGSWGRQEEKTLEATKIRAWGCLCTALLDQIRSQHKTKFPECYVCVLGNRWILQAIYYEKHSGVNPLECLGIVCWGQNHRKWMKRSDVVKTDVYKPPSALVKCLAPWISDTVDTPTYHRSTWGQWWQASVWRSYFIIKPCFWFIL